MSQLSSRNRAPLSPSLGDDPYWKEAARRIDPRNYRCQFCIKRAIISQDGLYLCATHARDEQPWPAEEIIELTEVVSDDLMPETVFAELYSGYGF